MNKLLSNFCVRRYLDIRTIATRLTADGKEVPKKKVFENRITLIGADNSVSITDLKNAQNLSMRRELKLVKIQDVDSKTRRPVYKLMTNSEYHAEELETRKEKQLNKQNNTVKGEKLLTLSAKIGEHDLMTNVNKMIKLLGKQYEVRVIVTGDNSEANKNSEHIYSVIEKNVKAVGNLVQKRMKGNTLKFQLLPLKSNKSKTESSSSQNDSSNNTSNRLNNQGPL